MSWLSSISLFSLYRLAVDISVELQDADDQNQFTRV
jgi:hypothetical protein